MEIKINCDMCSKPADVHEIVIRKGIKKEIHLCAQHALEHGMAPQENLPIFQVLTQIGVLKGNRRTKAVTKKACPTCGLSFSQFRRVGVLGCPDCYQQFESELSPLVERAHNGGGHHTGKAPKRAGKSIDRQRQIQQILKELDRAVAAEQYERAAELRDHLRSLEVSFPTRFDASAAKA